MIAGYRDEELIAPPDNGVMIAIGFTCDAMS
jgi:hypothetical protein